MYCIPFLFCSCIHNSISYHNLYNIHNQRLAPHQLLQPTKQLSKTLSYQPAFITFFLYCLVYVQLSKQYINFTRSIPLFQLLHFYQPSTHASIILQFNLQLYSNQPFSFIQCATTFNNSNNIPFSTLFNLQPSFCFLSCNVL